MSRILIEPVPKIGDIIISLWEMIGQVTDQFYEVTKDPKTLGFKNVFPPNEPLIRDADRFIYKPAFLFKESSLPKDYISTITKPTLRGGELVHRYQSPSEVGHPNFEERYGNVVYTDWTTGLKKHVVEDLDLVAKQMGSQFRVDWTISGAHVWEKGRKSRHYSGNAIDLNYIDGQSIAEIWKENPNKIKTLLANLKKLHPGMEVVGPGSKGHGNHIHIGWPRSL